MSSLISRPARPWPLSTLRAMLAAEDSVCSSGPAGSVARWATAVKACTAFCMSSNTGMILARTSSIIWPSVSVAPRSVVAAITA